MEIIMLEPWHYGTFFGGIAIVMAVAMGFIGFRFLHNTNLLMIGLILAALGVVVIIISVLIGKRKK